MVVKESLFRFVPREGKAVDSSAVKTDAWRHRSDAITSVDMHLEVDPQMTMLRSHVIAHDVKDKIREAIPAVSDVLVHIEPLNIPARPPSPP